MLNQKLFQSTLPAWGATYALTCQNWAIPISIHAPRMGSDANGAHVGVPSSRFQSTLPAWGATVTRCRVRIGLYPFQSTLPAWGATMWMAITISHTVISIHAPRMGSDVTRKRFYTFIAISIHAPRMGSDNRILHRGGLKIFQSTLPAWGATWARRYWTARKRFQSTLPAWGATPFHEVFPVGFCISIHAPRMGSDLNTAKMTLSVC